jgi:hypothetical protein
MFSRYDPVITLQLPYENINNFDLTVDSSPESGYTQLIGFQLMRAVNNKDSLN